MSSSSAAAKSSAAALANIVSFCKRRGFVFPGSEIYGGLAGSFDYGPLGTQLKLNIKSEWWKRFVTRRPKDCVGLDSGILLSPKVWEASGHLENFTDPLSECGSCRKRVRTDHHLAAVLKKDVQMNLVQLKEEVSRLKASNGWCCPYCKSADLSDPKEFNLLFTTKVGPTGGGETAYFRPETAQGAYINVNNVAVAARKTKLPFGIAQIGTAFRNEVSPRDFIFRTREFEQLELQWFCSKEESMKWHAYWIEECIGFCVEQCGLRKENIRVRKHEKEELAHYALATSDLEFNYPFGFGEFWGIANRGNHDLTAHSKASGTPLLAAMGGPENVHIVEPSLGLNRLFLAILCDAFEVEAETKRTVLRLSPQIAPFEAAVFPVVANNEQIVAKTREVFQQLLDWDCRADLDDASTSVGKKYRRHDEIGTPICIVVDDQTLKDSTVTFRDRDSMKQVRLSPKDFESKNAFYSAVKSSFA